MVAWLSCLHLLVRTTGPKRWHARQSEQGLCTIISFSVPGGATEVPPRTCWSLPSAPPSSVSNRYSGSSSVAACPVAPGGSVRRYWKRLLHPARPAAPGGFSAPALRRATPPGSRAPTMGECSRGACPATEMTSRQSEQGLHRLFLVPHRGRVHVVEVLVQPQRGRVLGVGGVHLDGPQRQAQKR